MPEIKLQHIVSFSSEDKNFQAEHLLKGAGLKKWKCSKGEKQASVTIQLEKASKIHQIDIGNEGAAFVEVLVGRSNSSDEYQVLLVASSFMNPADSRSGQNLNRVRMFGPDTLNKAACDQKWDRVKLVCTQPFARDAQYGLSFVKLHSPPEPGESPASSSSAAAAKSKTQTTLGAFKLKASEEEDNIKTGSLFVSRDKPKMESSPQTGAAAVRAASTMDTDSHTPPQVKRKHSVESATSSSKSTTFSRTPEGSRGESSARPTLHKQSTSISSIASAASSACRSRDGQPSIKRTKTEPPKPSREVAFHKLMKRVVFVMSGFKNPLRGELRDKATEMGATYRPDWGKGCTHLICAFDNTPKYNEVKGKGRIVKKDWLVECHKQKKLLPWRKYRVGKARSPPVTSDDNSDTDEELVAPTSKHTMPTLEKQDSDAYGASTDADSSDVDTEDEIKRFVDSASQKESEHKLKGPKASMSSVKTDDTVYDISTGDEEADEKPTNGAAATNSVGDDSDAELPALPDFFHGKSFMIHGGLSSDNRRTLKRYIIAYNGKLEEYMGEAVSYVITDTQWDSTFDDALADNPSLSFVKPKWILACNENQKLMPFQKYMVVPA